jgi:hypothetical protein
MRIDCCDVQSSQMGLQAPFLMPNQQVAGMKSASNATKLVVARGGVKTELKSQVRTETSQECNNHQDDVRSDPSLCCAIYF